MNSLEVPTATPKSALRQAMPVLVAMSLVLVLVIIPLVVHELVDANTTIRCDEDGENCDPFDAMAGDMAVLLTYSVEVLVAMVVIPVWFWFRGRARGWGGPSNRRWQLAASEKKDEPGNQSHTRASD